MIIHFRDVTDEPVFAAEAAGALENASLYREAKRTSALLDSLYNSAPIGLGFWDRDLRYVRVNNALAVINERPPEDHPGRTFAEVVPHLAPALESIARARARDGRAGDRARDGRGHAERPDGAAVLARRATTRCSTATATRSASAP